MQCLVGFYFDNVVGMCQSCDHCSSGDLCEASCRVVTGPVVAKTIEAGQELQTDTLSYSSSLGWLIGIFILLMLIVIMVAVIVLSKCFRHFWPCNKTDVNAAVALKSLIEEFPAEGGFAGAHQQTAGEQLSDNAVADNIPAADSNGAIPSRDLETSGTIVDRDNSSSTRSPAADAASSNVAARGEKFGVCPNVEAVRRSDSLQHDSAAYSVPCSEMIEECDSSSTGLKGSRTRSSGLLMSAAIKLPICDSSKQREAGID